jgi:hypothetical protein
LKTQSIKTSGFTEDLAKMSIIVLEYIKWF